MKKYLLSIIILGLLITVGTVVRGAENTFQTSIAILVDDSIDPSIPTGLTATALSSTQINLSWNASTDNVGVTGYRIFRDSVIIASTTSIFYQDSGLTASTSYDYTVEAFDYQLNYSGQSATATAVTDPAPVTPPAATSTPSGGGGSSGYISPDLYQLTNVSDFRATPLENSIALTWRNPLFRNFDGVRIVKSDKFFPRDIYDGELVYEGTGESYMDTKTVPGVTYYYSIFAKNTFGLYSSGALASARIYKAGEVITPTKGPFDNIPIIKNVHPAIDALTLYDFDFIQSSRKLAIVGDTLAIDGTRNLTISLSYEKLPEVLKTIAVTLTDPDDSSLKFTFLLRVNKEKSAFEATIAPLGKSGRYTIDIIILDYKNQGLKKIEGNLRALAFSGSQHIITGFEGVTRTQLSLLIIFLIILLIIYIVGIHRKGKSENLSDEV